MPNFQDRVVVVTGAAGTLGGVIADAFLAAGARLVLPDFAGDRLSARFAALRGQPNHLLFPGADLTDAGTVTRLIDEAAVKLGGIDVVVNAVGGFRGGQPLHEAPLADWDVMLQMNLRPTVLVCRAAIPHLLRRRAGRIINIGARPGAGGVGGLSAYGASKAAVIRLTESLSEELKERGITANSVLPSTMDTPDNRAAMPDADPTRWVEPAAVADVVLFLAGSGGRAVSGAAIPVYGLA